MLKKEMTMETEFDLTVEPSTVEIEDEVFLEDDDLGETCGSYTN
jgi:hypothetical protein